MTIKKVSAHLKCVKPTKMVEKDGIFDRFCSKTISEIGSLGKGSHPLFMQQKDRFSRSLPKIRRSQFGNILDTNALLCARNHFLKWETKEL